MNGKSLKFVFAFIRQTSPSAFCLLAFAFKKAGILTITVSWLVCDTGGHRLSLPHPRGLSGAPGTKLRQTFYAATTESFITLSYEEQLNLALESPVRPDATECRAHNVPIDRPVPLLQTVQQVRLGPSGRLDGWRMGSVSARADGRRRGHVDG